MKKFREFTLDSGNKIFLGKNAGNNDELVKSFKGKENSILHTVEPGSPFCVFENSPSKDETYEGAVICASKSKDWRERKNDVKMHIFTGKDVKKTIFMKPGTWKIKSSPKVLNVKKKDIESWIKERKTNT